MDNCSKLVINNGEYILLLATIVKANVQNTKEERLELVEISKGLIEILQNTGFTIEKILECGPSHIAEILGIDDYIGELIYQETKKATRSIISNSNF